MAPAGGAGGDAAAQAAITAAITSQPEDNRYDAESKTLVFTAGQVGAFAQLIRYYSAFFSEPTTEFGLRRSAITDPTELRQLTAFFAWTAVGRRSRAAGQRYSYTNNWPGEASIGNTPTADSCVERALADRADRRHGPAARALRPL